MIEDDKPQVKKYALIHRIKQYPIHLKYLPNMCRFELLDILDILSRHFDGEIKDYNGARTELAKKYLI